MGYSRTIPFVSIPSTSTTTSVRQAVLNSAPATKAMGTIKTLDYSLPISHVFARLYVETVKDTSGAENCTETSAQTLNLFDGTANIVAGVMSGSHFLVPANGYAHNIVVHFPTNIVSQVKPDTSYICTLLNAEAIGDNLELYYPQVILDCYAVI